MYFHCSRSQFAGLTTVPGGQPSPSCVYATYSLATVFSYSLSEEAGREDGGEQEAADGLAAAVDTDQLQVVATPGTDDVRGALLFPPAVDDLRLGAEAPNELVPVRRHLE